MKQSILQVARQNSHKGQDRTAIGDRVEQSQEPGNREPGHNRRTRVYKKLEELEYTKSQKTIQNRMKEIVAINAKCGKRIKE